MGWINFHLNKYGSCLFISLPQNSCKNAFCLRLSQRGRDKNAGGQSVHIRIVLQGSTCRPRQTKLRCSECSTLKICASAIIFPIAITCRLQPFWASGFFWRGLCCRNMLLFGYLRLRLLGSFWLCCISFRIRCHNSFPTLLAFFTVQIELYPDPVSFTCTLYGQ